MPHIHFCRIFTFGRVTPLNWELSFPILLVIFPPLNITYQWNSPVKYTEETSSVLTSQRGRAEISIFKGKARKNSLIMVMLPYHRFADVAFLANTFPVFFFFRGFVWYLFEFSNALVKHCAQVPLANSGIFAFCLYLR